MKNLSALTLYAKLAEQQINPKALRNYLRSIGLIAESYAEQGNQETYLTGNHFFRHITFLGCAPKLVLRPAEGEQFMSITLIQSPHPVLYTGKLAKPPLCPHCSIPLIDWKQLIQASKNLGITCPECKTAFAIDTLHFRKLACYSKTVIQIAPVFEREAQPDSLFLSKLAHEFGVKFEHCFQ